MGETTNIEWCDRTFNPWIGCTKVSPACDHCYAEALMDTRHKRAKWGPGNPRSRTAASTWKNPLKWQRQATAFAEEHGRRQRVFCASLADVFDNEVPTEWRADLFELICATPELDWLLLTKRIGNVKKMLAEIGMDALPENVWLGATICNQAEADRDVPKLLDIKARVRFLSMEPLLGYVTIEKWLPSLDWIIVGGESGAKARDNDFLGAARQLRDECARHSAAFFGKQGVKKLPLPADLARQEFPRA